MHRFLLDIGLVLGFVWVVASSMTFVPELEQAQGRFCLAIGLLAFLALSLGAIMRGVHQKRNRQREPRQRNLWQQLKVPLFFAFLLAFAILTPVSQHLHAKQVQRSHEIALASPQAPPGTTFENEYDTSFFRCSVAAFACGGILAIWTWIELLSALGRIITPTATTLPKN